MNNLRCRLNSLLIFAGIAVPWTVSAQSIINKIIGFNSIESRLTQLERISDAYSQLFIQIQQQISENQSDIDSLRGQIQENQHHLNQIAENQRKISLQMNEIREKNINLKLPSKKENNKKIPLISEENYIADRTMMQYRDSANRDYKIALMLMKNKSYHDESIFAFQNFIRRYPNSIYQPNAYYWLGQLNYSNGRENDAIYYFNSVVKNYPKSSKASNAMYKIGLIIYSKGDVKKARDIFQKVEKRYPGTESARQASKYLNSIKN